MVGKEPCNRGGRTRGEMHRLGIRLGEETFLHGETQETVQNPYELEKFREPAKKVKMKNEPAL